MSASTYTLLVSRAKTVVDAVWFSNVETLLNLNHGVFTAMSEAFQKLQDKDQKDQFLTDLQTRLKDGWTEHLSKPAGNFYSVAVEYYKTAKTTSEAKIQNLKVLAANTDYVKLFEDVRTKLGVAWDTQVSTALQQIGNPAVYVYNLLVDVYAKLPKEASYLSWIDSAKVSLGLFYDERLQPYLKTWWDGAKTSENIQKISEAVSTFKSSDLFSYIYNTTLVVAKNGVDYLLPATADSLSADKVEDLTVGYLVNTTATRLNDRISSNIEQIKLQHIDVLTYASTVLESAKKVVEHNSGVLKEYVAQGTDALTKLRELIAKQQVAQEVRAHVESLQSAPFVSSTYAVLKSSSSNAAALVHSILEKPSDLPRHSLVFFVQGLGLQAKDEGFEDAVQYLQSLLVSVKKIVAIVPLADTSTAIAASDGTPASIDTVQVTN